LEASFPCRRRVRVSKEIRQPFKDYDANMLMQNYTKDKQTLNVFVNIKSFAETKHQYHTLHFLAMGLTDSILLPKVLGIDH
jgi:hypothetical protein